MLFDAPYLPIPSLPAAVLPLSKMARRLGVSQKWLRDQAEAGIIPAIRAGPGRFLFSIAVTEAAIAQLLTSQAPQANVGELPHFPTMPTM